jgi:hypothetical protein
LATLVFVATAVSRGIVAVAGGVVTAATWRCLAAAVGAASPHTAPWHARLGG